MPRKAGPPKRAYNIVKPIPIGCELTDSSSRRWTVDKTIGQGGFGSLYSAFPKGESSSNSFVLKIEPQENGPLFTEINFYRRVCISESLEDWKIRHRLNFLGIPRFIGNGLFQSPSGDNCRFLVMDRFQGSFEDCLSHHLYTTSDIPLIAIKMLEALEYIHNKAYVHADIKASNLLHGTGKFEFYLADFGLASTYIINGHHRPEKPSSKLKDNGTLEFCSIDAHKGLHPSRRGDLQIVVFNLIHWLFRSKLSASQGSCAGLPWEKHIDDPTIRSNLPSVIRTKVVQLKNDSLDNPLLLTRCLDIGDLKALNKFIEIIGDLEYSEEPDYSSLICLLNTLSKTLKHEKKLPLKENHSENKIVVREPQLKSDEISSSHIHRAKMRPAVNKSKQVLKTSKTGDKRKSRNVSLETIDLMEDGIFDSPKSPILNLSKRSLVDVTARSSPRLKTKPTPPPQSVRFSPLNASKKCTPRSALSSSRRIKSPLLLSSLCDVPDHGSSSKVLKSSSSTQTSPHLLLIAKAEAMRRRRLLLH